MNTGRQLCPHLAEVATADREKEIEAKGKKALGSRQIENGRCKYVCMCVCVCGGGEGCQVTPYHLTAHFSFSEITRKSGINAWV